MLCEPNNTIPRQPNSQITLTHSATKRYGFSYGPTLPLPLDKGNIRRYLKKSVGPYVSSLVIFITLKSKINDQQVQETFERTA